MTSKSVDELTGSCYSIALELLVWNAVNLAVRRFITIFRCSALGQIAVDLVIVGGFAATQLLQRALDYTSWTL